MSETREVVQGQSENAETTHELSILMQRVLGTDNSPDFTSEQVDELLSQKRQVNEFVHEDKKRDSADAKFYMVVILVFILLFTALILWRRPDYFGEVLSFLAGLFGGSLGGYGWSSRHK